MTTATSQAELPLAGIRVIDVATVIAAPHCATILGEFGADVLKVEHPMGGDVCRKFGTPTHRGDTLAWFGEARNKKSVTIDLHRPDGVELFKRLIEKADVLCENFRTGTLEKWGLGWEVLQRINPGLIGAAGDRLRPDRPVPGPARLCAHRACRRRHCLPVRDAQGDPVTPGSTTLGDYLTGLYGCVGVLMALRYREQTGFGPVRRCRSVRVGVPLHR